MENILKDIAHIYQRLFDHHPVIHSECGFFYQHFEGNHRNAEFDSLLQTSHLLNEAVDTEIEERLTRSPFDEINLQMEMVTRMLEKVLEKGQKSHEDYIQSLAKNREFEWMEFDKDLQRKRQQMDDQIAQHLVEINDRHEKNENEFSEL